MVFTFTEIDQFPAIAFKTHEEADDCFDMLIKAFPSACLCNVMVDITMQLDFGVRNKQ